MATASGRLWSRQNEIVGANCSRMRVNWALAATASPPFRVPFAPDQLSPTTFIVLVR